VSNKLTFLFFINYGFCTISLFTFIPNSYLTMDTKQFIERVYELAFGHDAINRNFGHAEVIEQLEEFNEDSLKWDSIPDDEKEEYENAFYGEPAKQGITK
tara:strand:- start:459 stop:758 length:300 start_codon:yes stop_codon:yes gene_type:complete